jgi:hypothetical protein
VIAWTSISGQPDRLAGKGLAMAGVFVPAGLLFVLLPLAALFSTWTVSDPVVEDRIEQVKALVTRVEGLRPNAPVDERAELCDPDLRERTLAHRDEEYRRRLEAGELGLAFYDRERLPVPLRRFEFSCIVTVRGLMRADFTWRNYTLKFPSVEIDGRVYLGFGKVELEER